MKALSIKALTVWSLGLAGWLGLSAGLSALGVPAGMLLIGHMGAIAILLWRLARENAAYQATDFLMPASEGPNALTPYGYATAWMSGFGTVGLVALLLMQGAGAFAVVGAMLGALGIVWMLIAPVLAESGARSLTDWSCQRFGAASGGSVRAVLALSGMAVLVLQLGFAGMLVQSVAGVSPWVVLPGMAVLILLAVLGGGFGSATPAQAALFLVMLSGVLVPAFALGWAETGTIVPHLAGGALLHETAEAAARVGATPARNPLAETMQALTLLFGLIALPPMLVRWPVERSGAEARYFAQRGMVVAAIVLLALPLFAIAVHAQFHATALATGVAVPVFETPAAALAGAVAVLDPAGWLVAALCIGALAAIVAGCIKATLLIIAALAARDPALETAGGELSRYRWSGALAVGVALLLALLLPIDPLAGFMGLLALATASLCAPLVLAVVWSGLTGTGALTGALGGATAYAALLVQGWSMAEGAALLALLASTGAAVIVSTFWPADTPAPPPTPR